MTCGVYKIVNSVNGHFYVGSSFNVEKRFTQHLSSVRNRKHPNSKFQNAVLKYNSDSFAVFVVEELPKDATILAEREQVWLDGVVGDEDCYNLSRFVGAPMRGRKAPEETRRKMSLAKMGNQSSKGRPAWNKGQKLSPELSAKLGESRKGNKNCVGRVLSEETRKKISESLKRHYAR